MENQYDIYRLVENNNSYVFLPAKAGKDKNTTKTATPVGTGIYIKTISVTPDSEIMGVDANTIIQSVDKFGFYSKTVNADSGVSPGGAAIGGGILGGSLFGPAGAIIGALVGIAVAEQSRRSKNGL